MSNNGNKIIRTVKVILISLIVLMVLLCTAFAVYYKMVLGNTANLFGNGSDFELTDDGGNLHQYNQGIVSFLIVGLDSDIVREEKNKGYRSDVMMLCVVDTDTNDASLVSFPRDTKAKVQVLDSNGNPRRLVTTKLNASFSYGFSPDKYGYPNTLDAVNRILENNRVKIEPIQYYVGFDMEGFVGIVEELGGVDITLSQDVPGFGVEGQTISMNYTQSLEFVRIRKGSGLDGSDLSRTTRQRDFVKACVEKIQKSNPIVTLPKLYNSCIQKGYLKTNMSLDQILSLAATMTKVNTDEVNFEMLPGSLDGEGYWAPSTNGIQEMLLKLYYKSDSGNAPVISEKSTQTKQTADVTLKKTTTKATTKTTTKATTKTTTKATTKQTTKQTTVSTSKQTTNETTEQSSVETNDNP